MLRSLIEKSLVRAAGDERYDLHELIRQYAADKLRASGQEAAVRRQHCEVYLALADRLDIQLHGPDAIAGYARLDHEQDNCRAALTWALETGEVDLALHLVNNLFTFWFRRGYCRKRAMETAAVSQAGDEDSVCCAALCST
jgi:predicted ATPase